MSMNERSLYHLSKLWCIVVFALLSSSLPNVQGNAPLRSTSTNSSSPPVIGILSQPSKKLDHSYHYIATSYVDWIEASGAVTIPIPYDASPALLDDIFHQINGILLPGGWNGYMPPSVPYILDKVVDSNNRGIYFPVWGTCLGYEFLIKYVGGIDAIQDGFDLYNSSIPLESVRFGQLYDDPVIYQTVTELPVTLNNHQLGIEPSHFLQNEKLTSVWNITSINYDINGRPFVSTIEPIQPLKFPFYGVQYHPEKNGFEYTKYPHTDIPYESIDHTPEGIDFSLYLSEFFVDLVRYGQEQQSYEHAYDKPDVFPLISSYPSSTGVKYEDIYIIPYGSHWATSISKPMKQNSTVSTKEIVSSGFDTNTVIIKKNNNSYDSTTTSTIDITQDLDVENEDVVNDDAIVVITPTSYTIMGTNDQQQQVDNYINNRFMFATSQVTSTY